MTIIGMYILNQLCHLGETIMRATWDTSRYSCRPGTRPLSAADQPGMVCILLYLFSSIYLGKITITGYLLEATVPTSLLTMYHRYNPYRVVGIA